MTFGNIKVIIKKINLKIRHQNRETVTMHWQSLSIGRETSVFHFRLAVIPWHAYITVELTKYFLCDILSALYLTYRRIEVVNKASR